MKDCDGHVYLASVLLEANRHRQPKIPSFNLSEWVESIIQAGFDGIEIWENHFLKSEAEEKKKLLLEPENLKIFSSYCLFENENAEMRKKSAQMTNDLRIRRIKYNIGKNPALRDEYKNNLIEWSSLFAEDVELLCECHAGTIIETPQSASDFFRDLPVKRFSIITHPFGKNRMELDKWFDLNGERISHLHVQRRDENNEVRSLHSDRNMVKEVFSNLKTFAYSGSYSLEFTEGINQGQENIKEIFETAIKDLRLLREFLP